MEKDLISKAWRIKGLIGKVVPGVLVWNKREVAFITVEGIIFNVTLSEIKEIKWPFLRMGLGFDAIINGEKFKFSFSKPNPSAPEIEYKSGKPFPKVFFVTQNFDDLSLRNIRADKATTKLWKRILLPNRLGPPRLQPFQKL